MNYLTPVVRQHNISQIYVVTSILVFQLNARDFQEFEVNALCKYVLIEKITAFIKIYVQEEHVPDWFAWGDFRYQVI